MNSVWPQLASQALGQDTLPGFGWRPADKIRRAPLRARIPGDHERTGAARDHRRSQLLGQDQKAGGIDAKIEAEVLHADVAIMS